MSGNRVKEPRERFQLALDGRQVVSVVVGSLVVLAGVFVLGLSVGRQLDSRRPPPGLPSADPLAALDVPPPRAGGEPPTRLSYHEALTKDRPPLAEPPRTAPPAEPPPKAAPPRLSPEVAAILRPSPLPKTPTATSTPTTTPIATPTPPSTATAPKTPIALATPPQPSTATRTPIATSTKTPTPAASPEGAFAIQLGSMQERAEAERLAERFKGHRAKVVAANIPGKGLWYRVRIGPFESRAEAERYLKDLSRETGAKGLVAPAH